MYLESKQVKHLCIFHFALQKTGKWNAMHVRIAWEIYNHQQKQKSESKEKSSSIGTSPSSTKSSTNNTASHTSTTSMSTASTNPSSLSTPPAGSKSSSSDLLGRPPPTGASDLPNSKPSSSDLLRGAAHGALFHPGIPRPPTDPFGLIRPPYPGPSLFGPSHLGTEICIFCNVSIISITIIINNVFLVLYQNILMLLQLFQNRHYLPFPDMARVLFHSEV